MTKTPKTKRTITKTAPSPTPAAPVAAGKKIDLVIARLRDPDGVTIAEFSAATGWQMHSVRGAIAANIKKKRGLVVSSEPTERGRVYRILSEPAA
jgi:hypothetical protein